MAGAPNTFLLKLKLHSKDCERKIKSQLRDIQGVISVQVDAQQGKVTVSGFVTPSTVISFLETLGRKAELLWEQIPAAAAPPPTSDQNLQIVTRSEVVDHLNDPEMVAQLQQLSGNKRLKNVEITYTKTVKLNFYRQKDEESSTRIPEITTDTDYDDDIENPHRRQQIGDGGGGRRDRGGSGGGGLCSASDSCCGGHVHARFCGHHPHHGCCNCSANSCGVITHVGGCPVEWSIGVPLPSAPPLTAENASPPPPPFFHSYFSDDNTAGRCNIM